MSVSETPKSVTDPTAIPSETINDSGNIVSSAENENVSVNGNNAEITPVVNRTISEIPTKETNAEIKENPTNDISSGIEQKNVGDSNATTETKQGEQSENVSEIQKQTSIGAGDTCFVTRPEETNIPKPEAAILPPTSAIDQTTTNNDKSPMENVENVTNDELTISKLKEEVQKANEERNSYQRRLENMEKKLAVLQQSYDTLLKGDGDEVMLRRMIEQLKGKLIETSLQLEDRIHVVTNQEKQISALNSQVASLKEVENLTKSLLQIRNTEVKHLQTEVDDMEVRIREERERYNTMINKMDAAVRLNADLKKEYETQLCLFRDLREKYEEKVTLLSEEKRALETNAQPVPK